MTTILSIVGALVGLYMFSIYSNKKICRKLFVENYFAEEQESLEAAAEMANRPVFPSLNVASITNARSFLRVNPDASVTDLHDYFTHIWKSNELMKQAQMLEQGKKSFTKERFEQGLSDLVKGTA